MSIPCGHDEDDGSLITSITRPNYTWSRQDGSPLFGKKKKLNTLLEKKINKKKLIDSGTIRKNGNLELYGIDSKDSGNYTCIVKYVDPDNEESAQHIYTHKIQVVKLPHYSLRGGNHYKMDHCQESKLDTLATNLPAKLNEILCKRGEHCDAFIFAPHCYNQRISIRSLIIPSRISRIFPIETYECGLRCHQAVQNKIALLLSRNLRMILHKPSELLNNSLILIILRN